MYIGQVLESFDRPAKKMLESIEFDPTFMKVKQNAHSQEIPNDILHITSTRGHGPDGERGELRLLGSGRDGVVRHRR